jgi:hypothetical protein
MQDLFKLGEGSSFNGYQLFDINGNFVMHSEVETPILDKVVELLLKDGKVKVQHGPGLLWDLDLERGVIDPKGGYHHDKLPPNYVITLDDETLKKLT